MNMKPSHTLGLTAAAVLTAAGPAHAQHADALLIVSPDGQLRTGLYSFDENAVVSTNERVFEGEFDAFGIVGEPGFNALSSTSPGIPAGFSTLPGNTPVTFTARAFRHAGAIANLWHWDATGPVSFAPVTAPTSLDIKRSIFTTTLDGSAADAAGFTIGTTGATGFLHQHVSFQIDDGDADPFVQSADTGFYLWSLEVAAGTGLTSEPLFFVHGLGDHEESLHGDAIAFVSAQIVPEPTAALGLAASGVALLTRRRSAA